MEWLALGGLLFVLLGKKPGSSSSSSGETAGPPPTPEDVLEAGTGLDATQPNITKDLMLRPAGEGASRTAVAGVAGAITTAATVLTGNPIAGAAAGAVSAVGGRIGYELGGTPLAATLGAIAPIQGNVAVLGAQGGKEIDRLLGGAGARTAGVTSTIAEGVGGAVAVTVVTVGIGLALGVVLLVGQIVYIAATIWTDLDRLKKGQAGALAEWRKEWASVHGKAYDSLRGKKVTRTDAKGKAYVSTLTNEEIEAIVFPWTDGFMYARNLQAYNIWMRSPRGVGQTAASHARYGRDRAYFIGDVVGSGNSVAYDNAKKPPLYTFTRDYQVKFAASLPAHWQTYYDDGRKACNIANWIAAMAKPKGAGLTEYQHARYWQDRGHFVGKVLSDGKLEFEGKVYDWREELKKKDAKA